MGFGQPGVQRHQARLGTEAEQRQREGHAGPTGRQVGRAHRIEGELPAAALHDAETQQQADRAQMGDQQIQKPGPAHFRHPML